VLAGVNLAAALNCFQGKADAAVSSDAPVPMAPVVVSAEKTHTLFMGADIAVNLDRDVYVVRDVVGSSWVINVNGQEKIISAKQAPLHLKITPNLKLTEKSATIGGFRREQAYTFDNDPSVRLTRAVSQSSMDNFSAQDVADAQRDRLDTMLGNPAAAVLVPSDQQFGADAIMETAKYDGAATHPGVGLNPSGAVPTATGSTIGSYFHSGATDALGINAGLVQNSANEAATQAENGDEVGRRLVKTGLDAMEVEFDISSEWTLHNPYIVNMTRFHPRNSKPGIVQNMIYAEALNPINAHPLHVHLLEGGFPFDFEVLAFEVHIYDRGVEIATNLASNRVELTRDEAFDYVKYEYIGAHGGETLPAVAAMGNLPSDLATRLATGQYSETYYVRVTKDGFAQDIFLDPGCSSRVEDDYLQSLAKNLRFKPALKKGRPVEGVAKVKLGELPI
jgi:hypothetical protein